MAVSFSSSGPHHVARFREVVRRYEPIWQSLDIRYSALRARDCWWNFVTEVKLHFDPPTPSGPESQVQLDDFIAGHLSVPISELDAILSLVDQGTLNFGGQVIKLAQPTRAGDGSLTEYPAHPFFGVFHQEDSYRPFWQPEPDSVGYQVGSSSSSLHEILNQEVWNDIERRLLIHDPPYFGLEDVLLYLLRSNPPNQLGGATRFWVTAPLYTRIESTELTEARDLKLHVRAPPRARRRDLRVVARTAAGSTIERIVVRAPGDTNDIAGPDPVVLTVPLRGRDWIDGAVIFGIERVDRFQLSLPSPDFANPRFAALTITDLGSQRLGQFLEGDESSLRIENGQEVGMSWLLGLCGLQVISSGLRGFNMGDAPDLVAFVPYANQGMVVETTLRDLMGAGKLVRLRDRSSALSRELPNFEVVAVAVTAKQSLSDPEVALANQLGIKVLLPRDLTKLREFAERNEPPHATFNYIKAKRNDVG